MSISEKLTTIEENTPKVYNAGYKKGYEQSKVDNVKEEQEKTIDITENGTTEVLPDEGKALSKVTVNTNVADSYDEFEYIRSRGYTDYNSWFHGFKPLNGVGDLAKIMPKHTKSSTNFSDMFYYSPVNSIPYLDTSNGENFRSMFNNCHFLTDIPAIDVSKGFNFSSMFYACGATEIPYLNTVNGNDFNNTFFHNNIKKLGGFNLSSAGKGRVNYLDINTFGCPNLEEISRIEGVIPVSISFIKCSLLKVESAIRVLTHLENYTGTEKEFTYKVSFHSNVWDLLDAEGNTAPHGGTWKDYVYSVLGWNY